MSAASPLRVLSHERGAWIVTHGGRRTAVAPRVGRMLLPLHGRKLDAARLRAELAGNLADEEAAVLTEAIAGRDTARGGRRALWLRLPLVPARATAALARRLAPLAAWPALVLLALGGPAGYLLAGEPAAGAVSTPSVLGLFLLTALWHELGHAAALAREGYPCGGIGVGMLFLLPVLFADVSLLGALPRRGRLRVDLAGVAFQLALGGALCLAGRVSASARAASWVALFAVAWSLLPFVRSDGYWALCDALDLPDLRSLPPAGRGRTLRAFVFVFRIAAWGFLAIVCALMALRGVRLAARWL